MLKREEVLKMFETAGAIRHGHFELSSGRHSGTYVQCALVLQYPRFAEKLGQALAELFSDVRVDAVVSPAIGGLIIGQEVARALPDPKTEMGAGVPEDVEPLRRVRRHRADRAIGGQRTAHVDHARLATRALDACGDRSPDLLASGSVALGVKPQRWAMLTRPCAIAAPKP